VPALIRQDADFAPPREGRAITVGLKYSEQRRRRGADGEAILRFDPTKRIEIANMQVDPAADA
jgi:hypothetical protein